MSESPDPELDNVETLSEEIEQVQRANESLAAERDKVCRARKQIAAQYDSLRQEFEELSLKCQALQADSEQLEALRAAESELRERAGQLESEAGDARLQADQLRAELTIAQARLQAAGQRNDALLVEKEELAEQFKSQLAQVASEHKQQIDERTIARAELKSQLESHIREAHARVAELSCLSATHQRTAARFEQACSQHQQRSQQLELENASLMTRLDSAHETESSLHSRLATEHSALDRLKRKSDKAVAAAAKLQAELELRTTSLRKSESALSEAQAMLSRLLSDVEQEGSKAARERTGLRERMRAIELELHEKESQIEAQSGEFAALRESESSWQQTARRQRALADERETQVAAAHVEIADLRRESTAQTKRVSELTRQLEESQAALKRAASRPARSTEAGSQSKPKPEQLRGDDLTRITGIGPSTRRLLAEKRISTFNKLANTKVARLERILRAAGPSFRRWDPSSWPEQAELAAGERWFELTMLQKQLERRNALTVEE